jgi:sigma-B regulation protein RsbU (phosphoserine phosphatase)
MAARPISSAVTAADVPAVDPIFTQRRLEAVAASDLLDSEREDQFDGLTRLAALLVNAPLAFVTIVDDRRSFWKSTFGIPADGPRQNTIDESFCQYVVRSGRELVVGDAAVDKRTRQNPSVEGMGVLAWAGFPLVAPDGDVLGSFCVVDTRTRDWTARDLDILKTLAAAASREVALRFALKRERQARIDAEAVIQTLQESLLPPLLPTVRGLDLAARFRAAGTGIELVGDFYDMFETRGSRWGFLVGDICGKGLQAAKAAALARHTVNAAAMQHSDPAGVMELLNQTFLSRHDPDHSFLTAVYGTLERCGNAWSVQLACAGHAPPIVRRADGSAAPVDVHGSLIGIMPSLEMRTARLTLHPGDTIVLYTDGVSEARHDNELFGDTAICALLGGAGPEVDADGLARLIEDAALQFCGGTPTDDIAVLVLRVPA